MDAILFYNAISSGNLEKIKEFHKSVDKLPLNKNVICGNHIFPLPLIVALEKGHYEIAKYFIENGADLDIVCKKKNKTPREYLKKDF